MVFPGSLIRLDGLPRSTGKTSWSSQVDWEHTRMLPDLLDIAICTLTGLPSEPGKTIQSSQWIWEHSIVFPANLGRPDSLPS